MRKLIAGNWKMNPATRAEARALGQTVRDGATGLACDLLLCPPATALSEVAAQLQGSGIALGGQDCQAEESGAYTGDISPAMLRDAGATHVIIGHSERRAGHGETDEQVRHKVLAAMAAGLVPVVCVGETEEQRRTGRETEVVGWQLEGSLPESFEGIVAYEPVWAIGTGSVAGMEEVATMHAFVFEELARQFAERAQHWPILYGGSVKPENASGLLALPHVGGALVGGASLRAETFLAIAAAV